MKHYVTPELRLCILSVQDVITASNDLEYDVREWIEGGFGQ